MKSAFQNNLKEVLNSLPEETPKGTVGCVALDINGNICAGRSTRIKLTSKPQVRVDSLESFQDELEIVQL